MSSVDDQIVSYIVLRVVHCNGLPLIASPNLTLSTARAEFGSACSGTSLVSAQCVVVFPEQLFWGSKRKSVHFSDGHSSLGLSQIVA